MTLAVQPGVHEHNQKIGAGAVEEGDIVGNLVILAFCRKQRLPYETLRSIYLNAGLEENQLPSKRALSDAFRLATSTLKDQKLTTRHGTFKVLVRDWKGGKSPRKDITLESQNSHRDRFEYTSPAVCMYYDPDNEEMIWDNRLNSSPEWETYQALEEILGRVYDEFQQRRNLVDGDAIYRSLSDIIESTAPLPLGAGSFLIWKEHRAVVQAIKSVITALNEFNQDNPKDRSSVNIFTVVNTEEDRNTISTALDETITREVQVSIERMVRIMREPESMFQYQSEVELENYSKLKKLVDEYSLRFRQESKRIDTQLGMLWEQHESMMIAVAKNTARKRLEKITKKEVGS